MANTMILSQNLVAVRSCSGRLSKLCFHLVSLTSQCTSSGSRFEPFEYPTRRQRLLRVAVKRPSRRPKLQLVQLFQGQFVVHVSGVERCCRFKQQDERLLVRDGPMFDAARYNQEFAFFQPD